MKLKSKIIHIILNISLLVYVNCDTVDLYTTTSTSDCAEDECLKPTPLMRRMLETSYENISTTPIDAKPSRRFDARWKSDLRSVFKWDLWCNYQPQKGSCAKKIVRYYYNIASGQCSEFTYSGCNRHRNNFKSRERCEKVCAGTQTAGAFNEDKPDSFCLLQNNPGPCLNLEMKFYYNVNSRKCKTFSYGGCGGNQNRFDSETECLKTCGNINRGGESSSNEDKDT